MLGVGSPLVEDSAVGWGEVSQEGLGKVKWACYRKPMCAEVTQREGLERPGMGREWGTVSERGEVGGCDRGCVPVP